MTKKNSNQTIITDNPEITRKITRYQNVNDNEIVITESKLENILLKHLEALRAGSDWKTPLSLVIAISTVFLTAEFRKPFLSIEPLVWQAIFIVFLVLSFIWLLWSIYLKAINWKESIPTLIYLIKNEKENSNSSMITNLKDLHLLQKESHFSSREF